jgi:DNA-binding transcriptional LysR family regulator
MFLARLDTVDMRLLRVFVAVVEARGFSAAQTHLNVSAPTVSNHIASLETRLGVKLCQRGRAGFKLTPEGETVYRETQKLFASVEEFEQKIGTLRARLKGSLAVGIIDNTILDSAAPLHRAIGRFVAKNRDVQVTLECRAPNDLLREMIEGRLDVIIGSFPKALLGLTYVRLYEERHLFYCGAGHPLFGRPERDITTALIARYPVIARGYWATRDVRHLRSEQPLANVNNMEAAARLILSGAYLGYLPDHYGDIWVRTGDMRALLPEQLTYVAPFEVAFSATLRHRRPARLLVRELLDVFGVDGSASFGDESDDILGLASATRTEINPSDRQS